MTRSPSRSSPSTSVYEPSVTPGFTRTGVGRPSRRTNTVLVPGSDFPGAPTPPTPGPALPVPSGGWGGRKRSAALGTVSTFSLCAEMKVTLAVMPGLSFSSGFATSMTAS